jgi:uncharacterized protein YqjF (DUF2071 family)
MPTPTEEQRLAARTPGAGERLAMRQRWESLLFLHWRVPVADIASRLPDGLHVDTFDGEAYLGVVPFAMRRVRPWWFVSVPWLSNFLELNVRTYVHDDRGTPGVWFFSLDADQPIAVEVARRWFHLNYQHARMSLSVSNDRVDYSCQRKGEAERARYGYPLADEYAAEAEPGTLEFFLLERYLLFSWHKTKRTLLRGQVAHTPYRYQTVADVEFSAAPAKWEGFEVLGNPDHSAIAHPVDIEAYSVCPAIEG